MQKQIVSSVFAACALAATCAAGDNSVCQYNLFVLGNSTAQYSNVQGRVGVGGNAIYTGYDFGSQLTANSNRNDIVVGGNLTFSNGQVEKGSVVANGKVSFTNVTLVEGGITATGSISLTNGQVNGSVNPHAINPMPFSFYQAAGFLQTASSAYGALTANGTTANQWGGLSLTGTDPKLNIFTVTSTLLQSVWGVQIDVPSGSTVLINVSGVAATQPNAGYNYTGTDANHVLFNYFQASTLQLNAGQGTVLAPFADITFPYGAVNGTVIGNSFTGNGQVNLAGFVDGLPALPGGYNFCSDFPGSPSMPQ